MGLGVGVMDCGVAESAGGDSRLLLESVSERPQALNNIAAQAAIIIGRFILVFTTDKQDDRRFNAASDNNVFGSHRPRVHRLLSLHLNLAHRHRLHLQKRSQISG